MSDEMFDSSVRSAGDLAGVFEYDGETGYFYLYDLERDEEQRIVGAIRVVVGQPEFDESDIEVRWDSREEVVGLFIRGQLCAAFEGGSRHQFGGIFDPGSRPAMPEIILKSFA